MTTIRGAPLFADPPQLALSNVYTDQVDITTTPAANTPPAVAPAGYEWRGGAWLANGGFATAAEVPHQTLYRVMEWQWWLLPVMFTAPAGVRVDNVYDLWRALGEDEQVNRALVEQYGINHWPPDSSDRGKAGLQLIEPPAPPTPPAQNTGANATNAGSGSQEQPSQPAPTMSGGNNPVNASVSAAGALETTTRAPASIAALVFYAALFFILLKRI